jgi:hypothetical protein
MSAGVTVAVSFRWLVPKKGFTTWPYCVGGATSSCRQEGLEPPERLPLAARGPSSGAARAAQGEELRSRERVLGTSQDPLVYRPFPWSEPQLSS